MFRMPSATVLESVFRYLIQTEYQSAVRRTPGIRLRLRAEQDYLSHGKQCLGFSFEVVFDLRSFESILIGIQIKQPAGNLRYPLPAHIEITMIYRFGGTVRHLCPSPDKV